MNLDLEERNRKSIQNIIEILNLKLTVDELLSLTSIYISFDKELEMKRFRLFGTEPVPEESAVYDSPIPVRKQKKKVKAIQIFSISKKLFETLDLTELNSIVKTVDYLIILVKEVQLLQELEQMEAQIEFMKYDKIFIETKF